MFQIVGDDDGDNRSVGLRQGRVKEIEQSNQQQAYGEYVTHLRGTVSFSRVLTRDTHTLHFMLARK
jgi:hypothetical protein